MSGRRGLVALLLLAASLHLLGIGRTLLPAQDGLKYLRIAREFQVRPWADVVRGADQHPLYPALVAMAEPILAAFLGHGPETWRLAAQGVAMLASIALLVPLSALTASLFDARVARLAVLIAIVLPLPMTVGHDTLSDSLALCASVGAIALGASALRTRSWVPALGCGAVAGFGFLARPEVLVVPLAVVLTGVPLALRGAVAGIGGRDGRVPAPFLGLTIVFLAIVGTYALVKGEVSEKLALRLGAAIGPSATVVRNQGQWLPPGLDDGRWDFSPKEEREGAEPGTSTIPGVARRLLSQWAEGLAGVFAFFALWGVARDRFIRTLCLGDDGGAKAFGTPDLGRRLVATYLVLFSLVLIRHASRMHYLSDRHTLMLVLLAIPWAAAGTFVCARGLARVLRWGEPTARRAGAVAVLGLIVAGLVLQSRPSHPSRWGHWAAGRWLASHANAGDAVLDTRGWAAFLSRRPSYDSWHIRQAFTDSSLAFIVVGSGEVEAGSRRGATLRAILAYAAAPVASFPERVGGGGNSPTVRIYRYRRPASWEEIRP